MNSIRRIGRLFSMVVFYIAVGSGPALAQADEAQAVGPGLKPIAALELDAPRTLELTHVEPAAFAAALGRDPERIFAFVRDQVAYEAYAGCLRGPRGTLLSLSGNSADRAALAASLLSSAGRRVRFARGTLSDRDAQSLVDSMWAVRSIPELEEPQSDSLQAAAKAFLTHFTRDCRIVSRQVRDAGIEPGDKATAGREELVELARMHYWVQLQEDGNWLDFDPSFANSLPGRARTRAAETFDALPEEIFHKVSIHVRVEEYPVFKSGDAATEPKWRTLLTFESRAADLSAADLVLIHQPENWTGPAKDIRSALGSTSAATGRVKPVLLTPDGKWAPGEPFRTEFPAARGLGGIGAALSGEGVRKPAPLATAEVIEFELAPPGGESETVTRELFDLAGPALRLAKKTLTSAEVREQTAQGRTATELTNATYDLLVMSGALHAAHLNNLAPASQDAKTARQVDLRTLLRRINTTFAALADRTRTVRLPDGSQAVLYQNEPRVTIADVSFPKGKPALGIDLRRDRLFAAGAGAHAAEAAFSARMLRGINDGTLERVLVEEVTAAFREKLKLGPVISASSMFEAAELGRVAFARCQGTGKKLPFEIASADADARMRRDSKAGYLIVAPVREIKLGSRKRFAWWRVDPATGETIAVTDEGLHQTSTERVVVTYTDSEGNVVVTVAGESPSGMLLGDAGYTQAFVDMEDAQSYIGYLHSQGFSGLEGAGVVPQEFSIPGTAFP